MASFTNLVSTPAANALNSKINTNPFASLQSAYKPLNLTSMSSTPPTYKSMTTSPAPNMSTVNGPVYGGAIQPVTPKTTTPVAPTTPTASGGTTSGGTTTPAAGTDNSALKSALQAHLTSLQSQLKDQQQRDQLAADQAKQDQITAAEKAAAPQIPTTPFGGMIGKSMEQYNAAKETALQAAQLKQKMAQETGNVMTNPNKSGSVRTGAASNIAMQEGAKLTGLAEQQAAETGLGAAYGNLAGTVKPSPAAYGQQVFNPMTGQYESGGVAGGGQAATIDSLAADVIAGRKSPSQAESLLAGGPAVNAQLDAAIKKLNPAYDRVQAEAKAQAAAASTVQTGTTGGQLTKASDSAQQSLNTLQTYFDALSPIQTGGIPWSNDIAQGLSKFFGSSAVTSYNTALEDARTQVRSVLGTSGVNPVDAGKIVDTYLPSGMTPDILKANMAALKTLIDIRVKAYTTGGIGTTSGNTQAGNTGPITWDNIV